MAVARRGGAGVILEKERNWYGMPIVMAMALLAAGAADGVILKPVANMYSRPSEEADVVSQAIYASHIGILEERSGWARVRTIDEYTGWMQAADFKRQEPGGRAYGSSGRVAQVNSLFANVYREASVTRHQPLLTVPFGTTLEGTQEVDAAERWIEVRLQTIVVPGCCAAISTSIRSR